MNQSDPDPMNQSDPDPGAMNSWGEGHFPGLLGIEITSVSFGAIDGGLTIRPEHRAPNGYLHAAVVVALADTCCGYGSVRSLPEGAVGFTTIELKSNFLGTLIEGRLACSARLVHGGRLTQVWDAEVSDAAKAKVVALFRCTQAVLWPRPLDGVGNHG
ncbi:MAG: PaaI family thioesterase [Acidimicrobiales bacterium]